jgi:hypothetical protein
VRVTFLDVLPCLGVDERTVLALSPLHFGHVAKRKLSEKDSSATFGMTNSIFMSSRSMAIKSPVAFAPQMLAIAYGLVLPGGTAQIVWPNSF